MGNDPDKSGDTPAANRRVRRDRFRRSSKKIQAARAAEERKRAPERKLLAERRAERRATSPGTKKFLASMLAADLVADEDKAIFADALAAEQALDDLLDEMELNRDRLAADVDIIQPDPARGRVDHHAHNRVYRRHADAVRDLAEDRRYDDEGKFVGGWYEAHEYVGGWVLIDEIIERATRYVALLVLLLHDDGQADEPAELEIVLTPDHVPVHDLSPGVARIRAYALLTAGPPAAPAPTRRGSLLVA